MNSSDSENKVQIIAEFRDSFFSLSNDLSFAAVILGGYLSSDLFVDYTDIESNLAAKEKIPSTIACDIFEN